MGTLQINISAVEGDSVLVKFASDKSAKPINEYDAVAFQPKQMGYTSLDEFVKGIAPSLVELVEKRDAAESLDVDLNEWLAHTSTQPIVKDQQQLGLNGQPVVFDTSAEVSL